MKKLLFLLPLAGIAGCSGEQTCNDGDAKKTAVEIVVNKLSNAPWHVNYDGFKIGDVETRSVEKETKHHVCRATLSWKFKGEPESSSIDYETVFLEDQKKSEVRVDLNSVILPPHIQ